MILALVLSAATVAQTPIEAERAFAADAQTDGQWTAFRRWSTDDATMFAPQPVNAHAFLKDRKDPPRAIDWWPTASYVSCDGNLAVNTGGWQRANGSVGYFTTVWVKQADGSWKWVVDGGDALPAPRLRPADPIVTRAACASAPKWVRGEDSSGLSGAGASADSTLVWRWTVTPDHARTMEVRLWDGKQLAPALKDVIAAPPQ